MNKDQARELAKYLATIFGGIAIIGFGLTLYQQDWPCLIVATLCAKAGAIIL